MALAKKCDRCGKYYENGIVKFSLNKEFYDMFKTTDHIDLCEECCEEFNKWLEDKDMEVIKFKHGVMGTSVEG